jgi:MFS family permease
MVAWMAGLLVSVSMMNYAPLVALIQGDFHIDNTSFGLLTSALAISHMLTQLPSGHITDTLGAKRTLLLGMTILGIAQLSAGLAPSFEVLLFCRFVMGIGTAMSFMGGMAFTNAIVPIRRRSFAQGWLGGLANVGLLLALLTSERLAAAIGWRGVFISEAIIILAVMLLQAFYLRWQGQETHATPASLKDSLTQPQLYLLGLVQIMTYGIVIVLGAWSTTFLFKTQGMDLTWAGPVAALGMVGSVVGRVGGGAITAGRERLGIVTAGFVTAICLFFLPLMPGLGATVLLLVVAYICASYPFGAIFAYAPIIATRGTIGRNFSVIQVVANIGAICFPPLVGYVLDTVGSFTTGFAILAAICMVGSIIVFSLLPRPKPREA